MVLHGFRRVDIGLLHQQANVECSSCRVNQQGRTQSAVTKMSFRLKSGRYHFNSEISTCFWAKTHSFLLGVRRGFYFFACMVSLLTLPVARMPSCFFPSTPVHLNVEVIGKRDAHLFLEMCSQYIRDLAVIYTQTPISKPLAYSDHSVFYNCAFYSFQSGLSYRHSLPLFIGGNKFCQPFHWNFFLRFGEEFHSKMDLDRRAYGSFSKVLFNKVAKNFPRSAAHTHCENHQLHFTNLSLQILQFLFKLKELSFCGWLQKAV